MREFNKLWSKVNEVIATARHEVIEIVEEICDAITREVGSFLDELASRYGFTYVIKPRISDGDLGAIVPCLFVEAVPEVYEEVKRLIVTRYAELVSESRLVFELKPIKPEVE